MRFREFINEGLFGYITTSPRDGKYPVYLNPTIADIKSLAHSSDEIRGMTVKDDVYVWGYYNGMHMDVASALSVMPNICFYLNVYKENPLTIYMSYSVFSGTSPKNGLGAEANLNKLLQFPAMQELKPFITIKDSYQDPMKPNSFKNKSIHDIKVPDDYTSWLKQMKQKWMKKPEENDEI